MTSIPKANQTASLPQFQGGVANPAQRAVRFGAEGPEIPPQDNVTLSSAAASAETASEAKATQAAARQLGLIKAGRIMWQHLQHADNREEIKAMGQYFLPRLAKYGTAMIPFVGFLLAGPVDWYASKHVAKGDQKIKALIAQGKLNPEAGPLGCAMQIEKNWRLALNRKVKLSDEGAHQALKSIQGNWNKMADHLFPDDKDGISLVREKLKLKDDGFSFRWIARAFHANRNAAVRFFKGSARNASHPLLGFLLKPIRLLMLGVGLLWQGVIMMKNGAVVQKMAQQAVRRVA